MTIWVVLPSKPEHFAYGPYRSLEAAMNDYEVRRWENPPTGPHHPATLPAGTLCIKQVDDVPTWTYATKTDWWEHCYKNGVKVIHDDGTPWTAKDWLEEHPCVTAINKKIWPRRISSI